MKVFKVICIALLVFSCNTTQKNKDTDNVKQQTESSFPSKGAISKIKYVEILPDDKAKHTIESWQAYNTIGKAINDIKKGDFSFFTGDFSAFELAVKDLETTLPKTVTTTPIKARLLALKTKLFKLQDIINLDTTTSQENLKLIKDVFEAFSNLNLQINKKFEKEAQHNLQKYVK